MTMTMLAQSSPMVRGDTNIELVTGILLFMIAGLWESFRELEDMPQGHDLVLGLLIFFAAGIGMSLGALLIGKLLRTSLPHPHKGAAYECGEPAIGPGWVQFDLRFYVVALVFIIFDVEIALFWPWAVVFGSYDAATVEGAAVKTIALYDMLFFFGVVVVGFSFLWRFGYLDWVRASTGQRRTSRLASGPRPEVQA